MAEIIPTLQTQQVRLMKVGCLEGSGPSATSQDLVSSPSGNTVFLVKLREPAQRPFWPLPTVGIQRRGGDYKLGQTSQRRQDYRETFHQAGLIVDSGQHRKLWLKEGEPCGQGHNIKELTSVCPCGCHPQ